MAAGWKLQKFDVAASRVSYTVDLRHGAVGVVLTLDGEHRTMDVGQ